MNNLIHLFKNPQAHKYLFQYPLEDGLCLFTKLFENEKSRQIIFACLEQGIDAIAQGITQESLCRTDKYNISPLYWFTIKSCRLKFLNSLLDRNPEFAKIINPQKHSVYHLPQPLVRMRLTPRSLYFYVLIRAQNS
ncbi:hypothetical protein BN59_03118 [Legionella massiliensis]|uniref:Uncharacterized protein n=1 Tax=Legionella massiliensis TaxID=1034943 RepID=A0A078L3U3_9GAMM|nr:hypothetical protein [Legionella massiliensis]CDZ78804.1 hypothetical protein BN59_03118 [Legionella massiliensis]CEE14542.1 hypothetical protein BN1094_03118 [Legionella massiliensis]